VDRRGRPHLFRRHGRGHPEGDRGGEGGGGPAFLRPVRGREEVGPAGRQRRQRAASPDPTGSSRGGLRERSLTAWRRAPRDATRPGRAGSLQVLTPPPAASGSGPPDASPSDEPPQLSVIAAGLDAAGAAARAVPTPGGGPACPAHRRRGTAPGPTAG